MLSVERKGDPVELDAVFIVDLGLDRFYAFDPPGGDDVGKFVVDPAELVLRGPFDETEYQLARDVALGVVIGVEVSDVLRRRIRVCRIEEER